jgi:hypothetical protein
MGAIPLPLLIAVGCALLVGATYVVWARISQKK